MRFTGRFSPLVLIATCFILTGCAALSRTHPPYPDPLRFSSEIAAFEKQDREAMPPAGAVVCVGSSSMRMWHDRIRQDLAPLTIIPRGFGGSTMNDLLVYLDRIVLAYHSRAVVIYEGDNDAVLGIKPAAVRDTFQKIVARIHQKQPEARVYVLSVKPSASRWPLWPQIRETNALLERECKRDPRLTYVDVASPLLDETGHPGKQYFLGDNLHLNAKGYDRWRDTLRPILLKAEQPFEGR
jgi:lysophospholipase L1-like esterase